MKKNQSAPFLLLILFAPLAFAMYGNKQQFCNAYADKAISQYQQGKQAKLPGIVPPVWSNDRSGHYNWCINTEEKMVTNGSTQRQAYLNKHVPNNSAAGGMIYDNLIGSITGSGSAVVPATPVIPIPPPVRLQLYSPGDQVSGLPVPIPRPELNIDTALPATPGRSGRAIDLRPGQPVGGNVPIQDAVLAFDLLRLKNDKLYTKLHYTVHPNRSRPIYAGAWLFGAGRKDVGVGYQPVALPTANNGEVNIVLTLPKHKFTSQYAEVFLLQSGKIIAQQNFAAHYEWNEAAGNNSTTSNTILKEVNQFRGAWTANIMNHAVEYIFTADGDDINNPQKFQWRSDAFKQIAKGNIMPGNRITARWNSPNGAVSDRASVELNAKGEAIRMIWSNGLIMTPNPN